MKVIGLTLAGIGAYFLGCLAPLSLPSEMIPFAVGIYLIGCWLTLGRK